MRKEDFKTFEISTTGTFRLVEEATLERILATSEWFNLLKMPPSGLEALGFATRFFRCGLNVSINELSTLSGVHRNQITEIEQGKLKNGPRLITLEKLSVVLGDDFRNVARSQGFMP